MEPAHKTGPGKLTPEQEFSLVKLKGYLTSLTLSQLHDYCDHITESKLRQDSKVNQMLKEAVQ